MAYAGLDVRTRYQDRFRALPPALQRQAIDALDATAILETVRTGASGIGRGERVLRV